MADRAALSKSSRALLAIAALLVFVIGLGLAIAFLPKDAPSDPSSSAQPSNSAGGDGAPRVKEEATAAREAHSTEQPSAVDTPPFDDLFALLAWLERAGHGPLPAVVDDGPSFEHYFASVSPERWRDAAPYLKRLHDGSIDGATLQVDRGVWKLAELEPATGPVPPDVTIAGSGVQNTLLLVGAIQPSGTLVRFTLRDCTVFTDGQPLFDMPRDLAAITLERVRVIGFDSGLGDAPIFRARGLALEMRDCEILGGYGPKPGHGTLFEVQSAAVLVRAERCKFDAVELGCAHWNARASVALADCTASALLDDPQTALAGRTGVVITGSQLARLQNGAEAPALEIDALFKNWRKLAR